jgi:hypothetical protein
MRMTKKSIHAFSVTLLTVTIFIFCSRADAQFLAKAPKVQPTVWEIVDSSLANLLSNGWKPINISVTDVATAPVPGLAGLRSQAFIYLLSKNGKYVTCIVGDPDTVSTNYSACRLIN